MHKNGNGNGPKCPQVTRLKTLASWAMKEQDKLKPTDKSMIELYADLYDALEWTSNMLENRRDYHKKRNLKTKHMLRILQEHGLDDEASKSAEDEFIMTDVTDGDNE